MHNVPQSDIALADEHQFTFEICRKDSVRGRWVKVCQRIISLKEAVDQAFLIQDAFDVAVFTDEGFIYWSKRYPDVFNTSVLEQGRVLDKD